MYKYVIKIWKKIDGDFFCKDIMCSNFQAVETYLRQNPQVSKIDLRIIREKEEVKES